MKRIAVLLVVLSLLLSACDLEDFFAFFQIEDITNADDPAVRAAALSDPEGRADIKAEAANDKAKESRDPKDAEEAVELRPGEARYVIMHGLLLSLSGDKAGATTALTAAEGILAYDHPGEDEATIRRRMIQESLQVELEIITAGGADFPGRQALVDHYCRWGGMVGDTFGPSPPSGFTFAYWICGPGDGAPTTDPQA